MNIENLNAKTIRASAPDLFRDSAGKIDHRGGSHRRHVHSKPLQGPGGIYFVTSESDGFRGRVYVCRRLEVGENNPAPEVSRHTWGHLAVIAAKAKSTGH
jgi:hypothetical protein